MVITFKDMYQVRTKLVARHNIEKEIYSIISINMFFAQCGKQGNNLQMIWVI